MILSLLAFFVFGFFVGKNFNLIKRRLGVKHKARVPVRKEKEYFETSHPFID